MIMDARFISVWDGSYEVETGCKVDLDTTKVFAIEIADTPEDLEICEREYVLIDGVEHEVCYTEDGRFYSVGTCRFCGSPLYRSFNDEYAYQCFDCDEDFYAFEQEHGRSSIATGYTKLKPGTEH